MRRAAGAHAVEGDVHRTRRAAGGHPRPAPAGPPTPCVFPTRAPLVADGPGRAGALDAGSWFAPHWAGATIRLSADWGAAAAPASAARRGQAPAALPRHQARPGGGAAPRRASGPPSVLSA
ncbi:MAG: hypothetical protein R2734_09155 [Nocardioides sp.]